MVIMIFKNLVVCGVLISPGKLLDVPVYIKPAAVYKRSRNIAFNPNWITNLTKVRYGNLRKRSLNAAIQEMVSPTTDSFGQSNSSMRAVISDDSSSINVKVR